MTSGKDGTGGTDPGDAVAQEAARLAEAVSAWARSSGGGSHGHAATDGAATGDSGEPAEEQQAAETCGCHGSAAVDSVCRVCPICRVATFVQAVQPEVIERVADVLSMFAGSLQAVAEDRRRSDAEAASGPSPEHPRSEDAEPGEPQHPDTSTSGDAEDEGGPR